MQESQIVIIDAVRTPIGRRKGGLASVHPVDLLATAQAGLIARTGIDPAVVGQAVGGCVSQIGEQSFNVTRTAWLAAGLPFAVAATTVDAQCGSGQQSVNLAAALAASGTVEVAVGCGVEAMSRIPIGANSSGDFGRPINRSYRQHYNFVTQFEAAERIAARWKVTRRDADELGVLSQERAARAWAQGRFTDQIIPVDAPVPGTDGKPTDRSVRVDQDEGLRPTSLDTLAALKGVGREDAVHTAGTSSQISDGAAAVLLATASRAEALGLRARATVRDTILVGVDPELMLTGPIDATRQLLERNGLTMQDLDVIEINEAFASVVVAWARELKADMERVNPNGGAIALGHPLGASGAVLVTKALNELERVDGRFALVTMCCGGGLGTGTLIERH
ncbi:steroid 3-ketoacyl-CoA thiolase [Nocardia vinacea]|uniref:Steroid 3-ketoacyl-CoA thiolase n=1 Tax=Nocardia vinacea TaxID=96468 RepID=A0ABZ1YXK9_9NOCA|nr:steroid 3-ketoacyl-CoA thiolase [Nocardia vinacea]